MEIIEKTLESLTLLAKKGFLEFPSLLPSLLRHIRNKQKKKTFIVLLEITIVDVGLFQWTFNVFTGDKGTLLIYLFARGGLTSVQFLKYFKKCVKFVLLARGDKQTLVYVVIHIAGFNQMNE